MVWWTRIVGDTTLAGIEEHETKLSAAIKLNFAVNVGRARREDCGLYRRNPEAFPDEPNLLPAEMEKVRKRQARRRRR